MGKVAPHEGFSGMIVGASLEAPVCRSEAGEIFCNRLGSVVFELID